MAVYLPLVYYTGLAFSETLFLFLFCVSVCWLYRLAQAELRTMLFGPGFFWAWLL